MILILGKILKKIRRETAGRKRITSKNYEKADNERFAVTIEFTTD